MVKVERSFPAPDSLAEEAGKVSGKPDQPDVIERLIKDFSNKCCICEMKELQDPNVEHLLPHKNGTYLERKSDWENLFWSCSHCNSVKNNGKYDDGIIDCCKDDPEQVLSFALVNDDIMITMLDSEDEIQKKTALLATEVFSLKNTGMRTYRSDQRLKLLQKEMNIFYKQLEKLHSRPESKVIMRTMRSLLRRESAFAAFKRCYVREHADEYPELQKYVLL